MDEAGNNLVAGSTFSYGADGSDIILLQYAPDGSLNWITTWGGSLDDAAQGMVLDDDFVYLAGSTKNNSPGMLDALVIKANNLTGGFPLP